LAKVGAQVIIPYRGDHLEVIRLKLCGDLGQILFFVSFD
jgi:NADH dehydrogenase (ubiquinone) 1 alpha subcomplex subunit 9